MSKKLYGPVIFSSGVRREAKASKCSFKWSQTWSLYYHKHSESFRGRNSVVSIAHRYGLDGSGFETLWGREVFSSPYPSRPALPLPPPRLLFNGLRGSSPGW